MHRAVTPGPSLTAALAIALVAADFAAGPAAAQVLPTGFAVESVIGPPFGGEPIGFTWLPDGRVLVIERGTGNVRLAAAGASTSIVIHTIAPVRTGGERGLLGVAVDPAWPARPYLYFSWARTDSTSVIDMRTASGDLSNPASTSLSLGAPFTLLTAPDLAINHNAGTLRFGTDGMLYASWGEDAVPCNAQDLTNLLGKILRLDVSAMPGAGPGPPPRSDLTPADNPFVAHPHENAWLIWAWGLRNPFRFEVDPVTGDLVVGDPGSQTWEELDLIPTTPGSGGRNHGWPQLEGPEPPQFQSSCGEDNTFTPPIHYYPNPAEFSAAVIAGPRYRHDPGAPDAFPPSYDGSIFLLDWSGQWMRRLVEGSGGWEIAPPVPGQPGADHWGEGFGFVSELRQGPDGTLWFMRHGGAWGVWRIKRVLPTGAEALAATDVGMTVRPNPARGGAAVEFAWPPAAAGRAKVTIVDAAGRRIAALSGEASTGRLVWEDRGAPHASGVYFWDAEFAGRSVRGKIVRVD